MGETPDADKVGPGELPRQLSTLTVVAALHQLRLRGF